EDGIRDLTVTGVQTCALPIYRQTLHGAAVTFEGLKAFDRGGAPELDEAGVAAADHGFVVVREDDRVRDAIVARRCPTRTCSDIRSEERRVGKECRAGWARCK